MQEKKNYSWGWMDVTGAYCSCTAGKALKRTLKKTEGKKKKDFSIFLLIYGISPSWDTLDQTAFKNTLE